ncbi:FAD-binding protein [Halomarina litorea]|uniref:FAD-binding protein n=1 Tax=Halomarina litorea TaxID=2961595 RepID=UPI0020C49FD1|nr:FAD-binding protein [Halomarina sp. BCD28]
MPNDATDGRTDTETTDVLVVGGGVGGLTAGIFTARAGLDTLVVRAGESILRRNAHLENYPGFPAGVNPRTLLDMTEAQAERAGCTVREGTVTAVTEVERGDGEEHEAGFDVSLDGESVRTRFVVVATKNDTGFLADLPDLGIVTRGSKTYVDADWEGRTEVDGLYAAGRVAEQPHQTVVAAGHGATVGLAVVEDSDVPYYHDWTATEGYFTGRGREVPPGCEEIDDEERERRERESMEAMREYFAEPHPDPPTPHPSQEE